MRKLCFIMGNNKQNERQGNARLANYYFYKGIEYWILIRDRIKTRMQVLLFLACPYYRGILCQQYQLNM